MMEEFNAFKDNDIYDWDVEFADMQKLSEQVILNLTLKGVHCVDVQSRDYREKFRAAIISDIIDRYWEHTDELLEELVWLEEDEEPYSFLASLNDAISTPCEFAEHIDDEVHRACAYTKNKDAIEVLVRHQIINYTIELLRHATTPSRN